MLALLEFLPVFRCIRNFLYYLDLSQAESSIRNLKQDEGNGENYDPQTFNGRLIGCWYVGVRSNWSEKGGTLTTPYRFKGGVPNQGV